MKKVLFVGSHLSKYRGTKGISEKLTSLLNTDDLDISLVSDKENIYLRMIDIIVTTLVKRFDIVHIDVFSNKGFIYADIASKIATYKNEYIVMTLHGGMLAEKYLHNPDKLKTVFSRAHILQSPSLFLIDFFKQHGIEISYMPNFIDIKKFPYNRENVTPYSLLWVRAFSEEYRPEMAIEVLHEVKKKYPEATLTMIGPDRGQLTCTKRLMDSLNLRNSVNFLGKVPNDKLYRYYQTHHVYLNTTKYESFGVAVLEAAACGIPIVSTKVGEIPYLWDDNEDIMICDKDGKNMSEKVMNILSDASLEEKLSTNARKKAESFDWEKSVKAQWIKLLESSV